MASPNRARGAKSRANLNSSKGKAGPGRPKLTEQDREVRKITKALLLDKAYQANLKVRLNEGKIQPGVEVVIWHYAFGKPVETIETKQIVPVRLVHEYAKD